ncbi:MAG: ATP-dependent RecD-like DNA helicase [Bacilli bacterium]|nr:ATP-dependent RecD-like DNA helicase [Bacilli bacterium]
MSYIKGNFKKYIFHAESGYTVGLFHVKETDLEIENTTVTFTGFFSELNELDNYIFKGEFVFHNKYGEQFNVSSYEVILPEDKDNIISFLSSELFKGIGQKKAKTIVNTLGENCLNAIINNPSVLNQVKGLTQKQKNTIHESLVEYGASYDRMLRLTKTGFSVKNAVKLEKYYQDDIDYMLKHPYFIIDDIPEITFPMIDRLRGNLKISLDDIERVSFGIIHTLESLSFRTGNIYFSYEEVVKNCYKELSVNSEIINNGIANLVTNGKIIIDNDKYVLTENYNASMYIAERILNLSGKHDSRNYEEELSQLEERIGRTFNKEQKEAIFNALNNHFSVITGGPGTGKTTIIKAITSIYKDIKEYTNYELMKSLVLLAPTGRASKRMSEESGLPSYTIHRFLKWQKENNTFYINEENKSEAEIVIIDEASMVDESLMYNLLLGLKDNCKIVLIGDYNQLPSVGAGQVLKDVIESNSVLVTYLEKLYRQDATSNINFFARDIIKGKIDFSFFNTSDDLTFVSCNEKNTKDVLNDFLNTYNDVSIYDLQILAPMYKGENGIDNLNNYCQKLLNKGKLKSEITHNNFKFKENDKVICLVNNLEDNVFNGDIGEIFRISGARKKEIVCDFDGNVAQYEVSNFDDIRLGYVISIHKAQGSEFDIVILPVLKSYNFMLYRKIIYTAVTRAKKKLIIIGEEEALKKAILTDRDENRKTLLKTFLTEGINY